MGVIGVPVIHRDPIEPGAEVRLHLFGQVAGEGFEVVHLRGILGRDNEAEVMPVPVTAFGKAQIIGAVGLRIEHDAALAFLRDTIAFEIFEMSCQQCCVIGLAAVTRDAGFDHNTALWGKQEGSPLARPAFSKTGLPGRAELVTWSRACLMPRLMGSLQHLPDERAGFGTAGRFDPARANGELIVKLAHHGPREVCKSAWCRKGH